MKQHRKLILFIATSLDGYIATKDDSVAWLDNVEGEGDNGFSEFYDSVDTVLLGRRTYDWIIEQELSQFPYHDKQCFVFTKEAISNTEHASFVQTDVGSFVASLKKQAGKNIWLVGGAKLFQSLFEQDLVDELIITVAPIVLGQGISLFQVSNVGAHLFLKRSRRFNQFVELHYEIRSRN